MLNADSLGQTEFSVNTANPEFNTNFIFAVDTRVDPETGSVPLELIVELRSRLIESQTSNPKPFDICSDEDLDLDPVLGLVVLDIKKFENQTKSQMTLPLAGLLQNGRQATGEITLTIWWLKDLLSYFEMHREQLKSLDESGLLDVFRGIFVSSLLVNIVSLQLNNSIFLNCDLCIQMEFQGVTITSENKKFIETINFDLKSVFDADDEESYLNFSLVCNFGSGNPECVGTLAIPIAILLHQEPRMQWFDLNATEAFSNRSRSLESAGKICVWLFWIKESMSSIVSSLL